MLRKRKMYSEAGSEIGIENGHKKVPIQVVKNILKDQNFLTINRRPNHE